MSSLTPEAIGILRHSLGINSRSPGGYRNHFVTGVCSTDYPICRALVADGLMTQLSRSELTGGSEVFTVTADGIAAARVSG
jgi:hypothetical protein